MKLLNVGRIAFYTPLLIAAVSLVGMTLYMVRMPGQSYSGPIEITSQEKQLSKQLHQHVLMLSGIIGERNMKRRHALHRSAVYIEKRFKSWGYRVQSQGYRVRGHKVRNIIAELRGQKSPGKILIVGAHYDSSTGSPGANDNASGVAAMLELARRLSGHKPAISIRFIAFVNEEPPYFKTPAMGSRVYTERLDSGRENIVGMLSLETMGYYRAEPGTQKYPRPFNFFYPDRGNFIAFVGDLQSRRFLHRTISLFRSYTKFPSEGVAAPAWVPGIDWSDHGSFWRKGYPAIMVTDTAPFRYPYYHTHNDLTRQINFDYLARVVSGLDKVIRELGARPQSSG